MQKHANKKVLAAVTDLFFTVKISEAANRAGVQVEFVKDDRELLEKAQTKPAAIIMDLNLGAVQPLRTIPILKSDPDLRKISIIGFVSHVQEELKQKAQENGCDMVLARSVFSQKLPEILKRHSGML